MEHTGKRLGNYAITLPQCDSHIDHIRYSIEGLEPKGYIIGKEEHKDCGTHYHIYLYLGQKECFESITQHLSTLGFGAIDLQSCRTPKHWGRYCTKEDYEAIYWGDIPQEYLHIGYRIRQWTLKHRVFVFDQFVANHYQLINVIKGHHAEYWSEQTNIRRMSTVPSVVPILSHISVQRILSAFVSHKHIYIHGETGVGKTTIAEYLTRQKSSVVEGGCQYSDFEFSEITSATDIFYAPDAPEKYLKFHRSKILRLADNGTCSINPKCAPLRQIYFDGQLVIVSNYAFPQDAALRRRFAIISIETPCWRAKEDEVLDLSPSSIPCPSPDPIPRSSPIQPTEDYTLPWK